MDSQARSGAYYSREVRRPTLHEPGKGLRLPAVSSQPERRARALTLLRTSVGLPAAEFRDGQWEAIEGVLRREKLLVVERTGWGKSSVYFLATRLLREDRAGCALLISPLLALMRNQLESARRIGVRAETINSSNREEWSRIQQKLHDNTIDILLVSPERLANDEFVSNCLLPIASRISLLAVDEAHCISDWGHDFRPDYRRIVRILRALPPNVPVLATTATANDRVVGDLEAQLGPKLTTIRGSLTRETLRLQALEIPTQAARMAWLAKNLPILPGSGIIYCLTVRDADNLSAWLQSRGICAPAYHADIASEKRERLEEQLLRNELKALVATVALGMGFDKPDIGFVIHFQRPPSVIHYYQQVGRAGRAVDRAYGILLSGSEDDEIADYFINTAFPKEEEIEQVLGALRDAPAGLKRSELQEEVNIRWAALEKVLKFLLLESPAPIQKLDQRYVLNPVRWEIPFERMERITTLRRQEQDRMREYIASRQCLMKFLATELNDPAAATCGRCANCRGKGFTADVPDELRGAATAFLNNLDRPIIPRRQWPAAHTFEGNKGKIAAELQIEIGCSLCRWGDSGFGDLVKDGKHVTCRFSPELVTAAATLIRTKWQPAPAPAWATCVPSRRHGTLVPDFARRLAQTLGIPFVECVHNIRETEPQKTRQNSVQQVRNLEGAFQVDANMVRRTPVLLIDDMVDSRWTFTVLGFKLRQAGSGPVFPFALADTSVEGGD